MRRKILLPRPGSSPYSRPITTYLFYSPRPESNPSKDPLTALSSEHNLILDIPGGGFCSMGPEHHEERLRSWAVRTGKPVISIEYGKAPECRLFHLQLSSTLPKRHSAQIRILSRSMRSLTRIESSLSRMVKPLAWLVKTSIL
jgi:hypothetical protein